MTAYVITTGRPGSLRYRGPDGWCNERWQAIHWCEPYCTIADVCEELRRIARHVPKGGLHVCRVEADGTVRQV